MKTCQFFQKLLMPLCLLIILLGFSKPISAQDCIGPLIQTTDASMSPTCTFNYCVQLQSEEVRIVQFNFPTGSIALNVDDFSPGDIVCESFTANCNTPLELISAAGFIDLGLFAPCSGFAPLSAKLSHFTAYAEKTSVMLEWIAENESTADYFEIEHSDDGRSFNFLTKMDGTGSTNEAKLYHFMHHLPVNGNNYYRLKQIDSNGSAVYSEVALIKMEAIKELNIYPSSVENTLTIKVLNPVVEDTPVHIFDATGHLILNTQIDKNSYHLEIPTTDLIAGLYFVKIKLQGVGIITKPFVKTTR